MQSRELDRFLTAINSRLNNANEEDVLAKIETKEKVGKALKRIIQASTKDLLSTLGLETFMALYDHLTTG